MHIAEQSVVSIHYTLTNDAGETLDTSDGREPLVYIHGAQNIIPGLENELTGKSVGDSFDVTIQPEEAYGTVNPELVQTVPHSAFEGVEKVEPGMQFQARGDNGETQVITVTEVGDSGVTVDGNHPLAGQVLNFSVRVEEIREATEEEIAHGHIHGGKSTCCDDDCDSC
ncbi:MAG: peptidylprolyl isomerase [Candidatus Latescibacterota bacterium]|nr:peptidylprolyl isomerase [Candidatus Latescibacterota bacterium]MEE2728785.1 peptidylprolyl isomerase [Candidatus Latescibacterota bacterium]